MEHDWVVAKANLKYLGRSVNKKYLLTTKLIGSIVIGT